MTYWITTDTHLGHTAMVDYCSRPPNFSEKIVKSWKGNVKDTDYVIHLGDVAWPAYYDTLKELPGTKILVKGNHDRKTDSWYVDHGFTFVCTDFSKKINGIDVIFSHQPIPYHTHDVNIHGHLHHHRDAPETECAMYSFALEDWGYDMVSLPRVMAEVEKLLRARKEATNVNQL